jgi:hypothetical protein
VIRACSMTIFFQISQHPFLFEACIALPFLDSLLTFLLYMWALHCLPYFSLFSVVCGNR